MRSHQDVTGPTARALNGYVTVPLIAHRRRQSIKGRIPNRRLEVKSIICVPGQPPSGSVGRVTPTHKVTALRAAEGRSVGSLRPEKSLRCAQRRVGRSGRSDPTFLRGAAGRSVGSYLSLQTLRPPIVESPFRRAWPASLSVDSARVLENNSDNF